MKISTINLKFKSKLLSTTMILLFCSVSLFAQTIPTPGTGDYVSFQSGDWSNVNTWRVNGSVPAAKPSFGHNVFINNTHAVTVTGAEACRNLYVNTGGSLVNGNTAYNVLTIGRTLAASTTDSYLINNGTIGTGTGVAVATTDADKLDIQINNTYASGFPAISTFTFAGNGDTKISALSAVGAGSTNTKTMTININHDASKTLVLTGNISNGARTLTLNRLSSNSVNEYFIMNINSPIAVSTGAFSFNTTGNTSVAGGSYTYYINSTLDLSRGTTTQGFIPLPSSNNTNGATGLVNSTILNVSGTYIMGSGGFTTHNSTAGSNFSKVELNILDGGLVDASRIPNIGFGATALALSGAYFNINGPNRTGKMRRSLASGSNDYVFPIGTPAGYSPVVIRNTGTTGDFTVGVIDNFTGFSTFTSPVTSANTLKNRFTIAAANATSVIGLLKFGWLASAEGTSFNRTQPLSLQKYGATSWDSDANVTTSTVSGTGTPATSLNQNSTATAPDPYLVTLLPTSTPVGVIELNANYTISQNMSTLPLNFLSFTGKLNILSNEVELKWITTGEVDTKSFEILESTDGKYFNVIGTVLAKNTSGIHQYEFYAKSNKNESLYYQLRQIDLAGKSQLSNIVYIKSKASIFSVYPNPTTAVINVNIPSAKEKTVLYIYSLDGRLAYSQPIGESETVGTVNLNSLTSGIYTITLTQGKQIYSQKFVKN